MILAGDVGGTKTLLAQFESTDGELRQICDQRFASEDYPSLAVIVAEFLRQTAGAAPEAACFGVAGPVHDGKAKTTNLPWQVEAKALAQEIGIERVHLINDLQAAAIGMLCLPSKDFAVLQAGAKDHTGPEGTATKGNAAVIAPGTGLGEAMLHWDGHRYHPIASEGGHADFAPRTDQEIELLRFLRADLSDRLCQGHVSYERILSGDGFHRLYRFLKDTGHAQEPAWLREKLEEAEDPNIAITEAGLADKHPLCTGALNLFCAVLGAEAGNLALRSTATSGIYIGGGIAPKILRALQENNLLQAFNHKGRFTDWMHQIPLKVALNPQAPLLGAAQWATENHLSP